MSTCGEEPCSLAQACHFQICLGIFTWQLGQLGIITGQDPSLSTGSQFVVRSAGQGWSSEF